MTPWVRLILFANIGVFFGQMTLGAPFTRALDFYPPLAFVRPWTIITYMFVHGGLWHIGFNMLALFFFGPRVEERLGSRQFLWLYFISGVSGAVLSFLMTPGASIVGASAAIFGVMLAFAYFWPDAPILIWGIIPIPARILVILTTVLALWSGFGGGGGNIAHFAHLGGYAGAFIYLKAIERRRGDFKRRASGAAVVRTITPRRASKPPVIDMQRVHEVNRDEVNRILDKISAQGMEALTPQERLFLSNFAKLDDRVPPPA